MKKTLLDHVDPAKSPKRILALDGGGIKGALSLGYLQKIEEILRQQNGNDPQFRLSDYFDLIGGTSTGSIIAACLAKGMEVKEITDMYLDLGGKIFGKKYKWQSILEIDERIRATYDAKPLEEQLRIVFRDITLESDEIKTGLCIVAKRADTNSLWPLINHPDGKYFSSQHGKNKDIPLWKAVRASTAAPTYFLPQLIEVGGGMPTAAFIDGGISPANNPSLLLLMVATLQGFPFHWKMGADNILLVSVGTGVSRWDLLPKDVTKNHLLKWARQIPDMLMQDANWNTQTIMQWISKSPTNWHIDGEMGDLKDDLITKDSDQKALLTYVRYNMWLDQEHLEMLMQKKYSKDEIDNLIEMSNADNRVELNEIGKKDARDKVMASHFQETFKI